MIQFTLIVAEQLYPYVKQFDKDFQQAELYPIIQILQSFFIYIFLYGSEKNTTHFKTYDWVIAGQQKLCEYIPTGLYESITYTSSIAQNMALYQALLYFPLSHTVLQSIYLRYYIQYDKSHNIWTRVFSISVDSLMKSTLVRNIIQFWDEVGLTGFILQYMLLSRNGLPVEE